MYETPFYAVTTVPGTSFHDFQTKLTITNRPTLVETLTPNIRQRLQNGGLAETDANGVRIRPSTRRNTTIPLALTNSPVGKQPPPENPALLKRTRSTQTVVVPPVVTETVTEPTEPSLDDLLNEGADNTNAPYAKTSAKSIPAKVGK